MTIAILCNRSDASPWALGHEVAALMLAEKMTPITASAETSGSSENPVNIPRLNTPILTHRMQAFDLTDSTYR